MPEYGNGGALVSTSQNYVNAYTGEAQAFDQKNTMTPQMKTYYNTEALENARAKLVYAQFGKRQPLSANHGTSIEWRKPNTFGDVQKLTEGVIPVGKKFGYSSIQADVYEYGDYAAVTSRLKLHAIDPVMLDMTEELSGAGSNSLDKLVRNEVMTGSVVIYAPSGSTDVTSRAGLDKSCTLTPDLVARARTKLVKMNAPTINGKYIAIIHPSVAYDLRKSTDWLDAHKYASPEEIYNGEIGELHGVRFVETTNAKIFRGENLAGDVRNLQLSAAASAAKTVSFDGGTVAADALIGRYVIIGGTRAKVTGNTTTQLTLDTAVTAGDNDPIYPGEGGKDGCAVYGCIFLGKDAYGVVDVEGGGMEMIHKTPEEIGGPLNQFGTVGVHFETATKILYEERMVRVECGSAYSDVDEAN